MRKLFLHIILLFLIFGCVDRIYFDIPFPAKYGISIDGMISTNPGPYTVNVYREFDVESEDSPRTGVSASLVKLFDGKGNSETLKQVASGVYQTPADGIQGEAGGIYHIRVELDDGRVYESIPDTLRSGGTLDSAYYELTHRYTMNGVEQDFDLYVNASTERNPTGSYFMWSNQSTYKALTHPELEPDDPMKGGSCYFDSQRGHCNYKDPCSGLQNVGTNFNKMIVRVKPCECCFCWYNVYNSEVTLNDKIVSTSGKFNRVKVDRVQMTGWNMMYKMRVQLSMSSLSQQAYEFWRGVRDQRTAISNLFQPVTGKINSNIIQVAGPDEKAGGVFYATTITSKIFYIMPDDLPVGIIPPVNPMAGYMSCLRLSPNATTKQPEFWIE